MPPQFRLLIIGLSATVLEPEQLPILENSTAVPPILGVPQPTPTNHKVDPMVTLTAVPVLRLFASVCTLVGSVTVIEAPFVLDIVNVVYDPVKEALKVFHAVSTVVVGATFCTKA